VNFFDTNVLIAASIPDHPHHEACNLRLNSLRKSGGACAAHTMAEAYSTLTNFPKGYGISPEIAFQIIEEASTGFTLMTLTPKEFMRVLEAAASHRLAGAIIYDALLIACARKAEAKWIFTNNHKHFRRIAPDLASRIVEP
jgi:predicted nucleic acid-binding protein